jgi:glycosyltransferase involved in cell wall biosynthesis
MMKKICFITTISSTADAFLMDLAEYLILNHGYDVTFICDKDDNFASNLGIGMHYIPVSMKRGVSFDGLKVILQLKEIFQRERFDIVQYATPNASFYASIAARLAGVKNRLYAHWGSRYMGFDSGIQKKVFKFIEAATCTNSTNIEVESYSLMEYSIKDGLYPREKASVIWNGSACGVRLENYKLNHKELWRKEVREKYNIPMDSVVFGWCGRITRDKGHNELLSAFRELNKNDKSARLLMVGGYDNVETIEKELFMWAKECPEVIFTGPILRHDVSKMYSAMDVFCSLSYREGFGLVVIEAAAMCLPSIVTDSPGQIDTIEPNLTGISVPHHDVKTVVEAMRYYINNNERMAEMGKEARKQVCEKYDQKVLFEKLAEHRNEMITNQK